MTPAPPPPPPVVATPETVVIDGFVIETYPSISHVPFASVSDQRGKAVKTSEHERHDELYGRCRTCMGHKSGEQLLLCDDCDRGYHMTCLVPALRDVPKGEWHCPNCTRDRNHTFHVRATAVAALRNVLNDIETRPSLPPHLQLKFLDVPPPDVQLTRIPTDINSPGRHLPRNEEQQLQTHQGPRRRPRAPAVLPPKCRSKPSFLKPAPSDEEEQPPSKLYKRVPGRSVRRRSDHISRLTSDLAPVVELMDDKTVSHCLREARDSLAFTQQSDADDEFVEARISDNPIKPGSKRLRNDDALQNGAAVSWLAKIEGNHHSHHRAVLNGRQDNVFYKSEPCAEKEDSDSDFVPM